MPSTSSLPNLDPQDETLFRYWLAHQREPTRRSPTDPVPSRSRFGAFLNNIPPERVREIPRTIKFYEWSRWRLFRINDLPNDVILHIFRQGTFCSPDRSSGPLMPLLYSKVCKQWRGLALGASWLWSFIGFRDCSPYTLTRVFLERSMASPLVIELSITHKRFDPEDSTFWPTRVALMERLSHLIPHIHRWKSFYCRTDNWYPMEGVLAMLRHCTAPVLKSVLLRQNHDEPSYSESEDQRPHLVLFGRGAPVLEKLVVNTIPIDWTHFSQGNHQLTALELHRLSDGASPTVDEFRVILTNSPFLRKLSINGSGPEWDEEAASLLPPIELLYLEELDIAGALQYEEALDYLLFVLGMMRFGSALRTLNLGPIRAENYNLMIPVLQTHFSYVERLRLNYMPTDGATVARWLNALPNVKHLTLEGEDLESAVFKALGTPPHQLGLYTNGRAVCPSLTTLSPHSINPSISRLLSCRQAMNAPIRTLLWPLDSKEEVLHDLGYLQQFVMFDYEEVIDDPDDEWEGPDPSESPLDAMDY